MFHAARPSWAPVIGVTDEVLEGLLEGMEDGDNLAGTRLTAGDIRNGKGTATEVLDLIATHMLHVGRQEARAHGNAFLLDHPHVGGKDGDTYVKARNKRAAGLIGFYRHVESSPYFVAKHEWFTLDQFRRRLGREHLFENMNNPPQVIRDHDRATSRDRWFLRREWHEPEARYNPSPIKVYDPIMALNNRMAEKHEADLSEALGARRVRGSGSQWKEKMDVRQSRFHDRFAFAVEAKSTLGKSIGFSRARIQKAEEQAGSERPMFAFRFYGNERLTQVDHDWVAMRLEDHEEMVDVIEQGERLARFVEQAEDGLWDDVIGSDEDGLKSLIEASRRECGGKMVDGHDSKYVACSCGWRWYVSLGRTVHEADAMLGEHLA